ncbi:hypothetical protein [Kordia sp.]|uniref:hypothetical protein n=1 Tax=Kordia sp. TaxID=1965332 RepID=UPI003B5CD082
MKKQKVNSVLALRKATISDLQKTIVNGGALPTTLQSTVVFTNDCKSDSCTSDPRPGTISHSNCGDCTSWTPDC